MSECLQYVDGPTPCFRESGVSQEDMEGLPCGLTKCPVAEYLNKSPNETAWDALHSICVITDPFDYKGNLKSIQLELIAKRKR